MLSFPSKSRSFIVAGSLLLLATPVLAITSTESDDFEVDTEGWIHPVTNANEPRVVAGGPTGSFLRFSSSGSFGAGSRLAAVNRSGWTGDYNALGSFIQISFDVNNSGAENLFLRLGVARDGSPQTRWISSSAVPITTGSGWQSVTFLISEAEMTRVLGSFSFSDTLDNVSELRIVSNDNVDWRGDQIAASVDIDNFRITSIFADGFESGNTSAWTSSVP